MKFDPILPLPLPKLDAVEELEDVARRGQFRKPWLRSPQMKQPVPIPVFAMTSSVCMMLCFGEVGAEELGRDVGNLLLPLPLLFPFPLKVTG